MVPMPLGSLCNRMVVVKCPVSSRNYFRFLDDSPTIQKLAEQAGRNRFQNLIVPITRRNSLERC
jgi:hypothetical protein